MFLTDNPVLVVIIIVRSADDHLIEERSLIGEVLDQFILGDPRKVAALSNAVLVGAHHLRFEEESLHFF